MKHFDKVTLSREEEALAEIGRTRIDRKQARLVVVIFFLVLMLVPVVQFFVSIPSFELPVASSGPFLKQVRIYNQQVIERKQAWESALEKQSFLQHFLPLPFQLTLTKVLHTGNEKAIIGRHDWLFYERDVRYYQTPIDFQSVSCIADFAEQLKQRGIDLFLMPVPLKPSYYPFLLSGYYPEGSRLVHPDYERWKEALKSVGVTLIEMPETMSFLREDTHWEVAAMEEVADRLACEIRRIGIGADMEHYVREDRRVSQRGDIYSMLQGHEALCWGEPQTILAHQVLNERGEGILPSRESPILLLGDSFSNIYSLQGMGWGSGAGLAEQLAYYLQLPVDAIRRNDAGSIATRRMLQQEMMRGRDRLDGKRLLVWEFAERELAFGDWTPLTLTLGNPTLDDTFIAVQSGDSITLQGTLLERSSSPMPDKVTYADHVIALHLVDLHTPDGEPIAGEALVYTLGMRNRELTPEAFLRAGETIVVTLKNWQDKENEYGGFNRNELDNMELLLQEPVWGEHIQRIH